MIIKTEDGRWKFIAGDFSAYFDTQQEAMIMSDKIDVIKQIQDYMGNFAGISGLNAYIVANEYGSGSKYAVDDIEAASVKGNLVADDVFNAMNLLLQVEKLLTNVDPTNGEYMPIANKVRASQS